MTSQEHKVVRAEVITRVFVVVMAALLAVTAYGVILIHNQQVANLTTLKSAKEAAKSAAITAKAVESCTTPGEPCFQRSQRKTGQAVANINRVVILAAACSAGLPPGISVEDRQAQIQSCVIDRLAVDNHAH